MGMLGNGAGFFVAEDWGLGAVTSIRELFHKSC